MDILRPRIRPADWAVVAASVLPVAAVVVVAGGVPLWAVPWFFLIVGLPSVLPALAATTVKERLAVVGVMSVVAAISEHLVLTIDDAQAGLAIMWVGFVAVPLALGICLVKSLRGARRRPVAAASAGFRERVGALMLDILILAVPLFVPLNALSDRGLEPLAMVLGAVATVLYCGVAPAIWGRTLGQRLAGLVALDQTTGAPLGPARAIARGVLVGFEVSAGFVFPPLLVADLLVTGRTGRSIADRLAGTHMMLQPAAA